MVYHLSMGNVQIHERSWKHMKLSKQQKFGVATLVL